VRLRVAGVDDEEHPRIKLGAVAATLYAVPASHPCACIEHALRLKAIPYRRVDLLPVLHKLLQQARFGQATVPGLVLDGVHALGSRPILRLLEARVPEPPLLPAGREERQVVERVEAWGDEVLQPLVRRLVCASLSRDPSAVPSSATSHPAPCRPSGSRSGGPGDDDRTACARLLEPPERSDPQRGSREADPLA
jgi:Glutathione S-transferase, N-terminal domain